MGGRRLCLRASQIIWAWLPSTSSRPFPFCTSSASSWTGKPACILHDCPVHHSKPSQHCSLAWRRAWGKECGAEGLCKGCSTNIIHSTIQGKAVNVFWLDMLVMHQWSSRSLSLRRLALLHGRVSCLHWCSCHAQGPQSHSLTLSKAIACLCSSCLGCTLLCFVWLKDDV